MTDDIQDLFQHIGQLAVDSVPTEEWEVITITTKAITPYVEENVTYMHSETQFVPKTFLIEDDELEYDNQTTPSFERLRELMYDEAPFRGAWYTAVMTITRTGQFNTEFDYDTKPAFDYEQEDEGYAKDFERFPRNEESTPAWLQAIVQAHGLAYHIPEALS